MRTLSVSPTAATAAVPMRPTKKTSTSANRLSMLSSSTMGMLNSTMARRTPIRV